MKKLVFILTLAAVAGVTGCKKQDFANSYADPSKISQSTIEKQFAGYLFSNYDYVLPAYWNYFVVLRTTITHYTQSVGFVNTTAQYVPGEAGIGARWGSYYNHLAQFREFQKVFSQSTSNDQKDKRIYMIAATINLYEHTQRIVDLHGDIPFSAAGMLSTNGGDYINSLPKYDGADAIYTKMLDDLKGFSDELSTISVATGILTGFKTQDIVNKGDVAKWRKFCNSLRLKLLTRVSGNSAFKARATSEITAILADATKYPIIATNADNVQIKVYDLATSLNSSGFRTGLEDWNGNLAGKVMIEHMKANADPRLRAMFEPGVNAAGVYNGLDPLDNSSVQTNQVNAGTVAIYNRSTLSRNQYFPGVLMNAAEVSFLAAEAYLNAGNMAAAKTAYEDGIRKSVEFYYGLRSLSNDNTAGTLTATNATEVNNYIASTPVNWDNAATAADKLNLIAFQKWIHYSVVQPLENWAELRRLDYPVLKFEVDASNAQTLPPVRWFYAASEKTYNTANYATVASKDNLSTKLFWDVK